MKKQKTIQEEQSTQEIRRQRAKEWFFDTVREIQQENKDADPD